jgi:hypothetical protein
LQAAICVTCMAKTCENCCIGKILNLYFGTSRVELKVPFLVAVRRPARCDPASSLPRA